MSSAKHATLSGQVVLLEKTPADAELVRSELAGAGFSLEPLVGNSFAIVGSLELFERYFGTALPQAETLPLNKLPDTIRSRVRAVLFTRPPDFGPTSW